MTTPFLMIAASDSTLAGVLIGGAIVFGGLLAGSLAVSVYGGRRSHVVLRISMALAGFFLSATLMAGWQLAAHFWGPVSPSEIPATRIGSIIPGIPAVVGVLAAVGPHRRAVKLLARIVIYVVSPALAVWLVSASIISSRSEEFWWAVAYLIAAAISWEMLSRSARKAGCIQSEEHGTRMPASES